MQFTQPKKGRHQWVSRANIRCVTIDVLVDDRFAQAELSEIATKAMETVEQSWQEIEQNIAQNLLREYNDEWAFHADLPRLSAVELLNKLTPTCLSIWYDGSIRFSLVFDAGDLFGGYEPTIGWTKDGVMQPASAQP